MKIYLASDHAGFFFKEKVKEFLTNKGFFVEDFGAKDFNSSDDYTDYVIPCVQKYLKETGGEMSKGFCVLFGGSGSGEAMAANRFKGARAIVCNSVNLDIVKLGRMHNNANVLSVGARFISEKEMFDALHVFQSTQFEGGRHIGRVFKLDFNS